MSHSVIALKPAINIVVVPIIRIDCENAGIEFKNKLNRINKNTPAVTSVDECTRALTGVGAAIAAGSHLENGICALFVIAAIIIRIIWVEVINICWLLTCMFMIYQ
jgi:hypothetical protein